MTQRWVKKPSVSRCRTVINRAKGLYCGLPKNHLGLCIVNLCLTPAAEPDTVNRVVPIGKQCRFYALATTALEFSEGATCCKVHSRGKTVKEKAKTKYEDKAVSIDQMIDRGLDPIGKIVTCVTATFGYRGRLAAITPDHYILVQPLTKIIDYGQMDSYSKGKNTNRENGERAIEGVSYVERSADVAIEISDAWQK